MYEEALKMKSSRAEWAAVLEGANPVARELRTLKHKATMIARGEKHALNIVGPPGCSKSYSVFRILEAHGRIIERVEYTNVKGLKDDIGFAAYSGAVVVLDDQEGVLASDLCVATLKIAADPDPPMRFLGDKDLDAQIVMISNRPNEAWGRRSAKLKPLFQRMEQVSIPFDPLACWEFTVAEAIAGTTINRVGQRNDLETTGEQRRDALEFLTENLWRLEAPTTRSLRAIAEIMVRYPRGSALRTDELAAMLTVAGDGPKPPIPDAEGSRRDRRRAYWRDQRARRAEQDATREKNARPKLLAAPLLRLPAPSRSML